MKAKIFRAEVKTSPNIALVKYWGKHHEDLIIPLNSSVSLTLDSYDLSTTTLIEFSEEHAEDTLVLNGKQHDISSRLKKLLESARRKVSKKYHENNERWERMHFLLRSSNSFPTASGMASSASGLSAVALCLHTMFEGLYTELELAELARMGSGSACRSMFGGLVQWQGIPEDLETKEPTNEYLQMLSKTCVARQLIPESQLRYIRILVLLCGEEKKETSSTDGMKLSMQTSELIRHRTGIATKRIASIVGALKSNDFNTVAETLSRDSNQFHALCLDTYPPIRYLNEFSWSVMNLVDHCLNPHLKTKIGYTFDAGPHAFLILHEEVLEYIFSFLMKLYQPKVEQLNIKASRYWDDLGKKGKTMLRPELSNLLKPPVHCPTAIWLTNVGSGPCILSAQY